MTDIYKYACQHKLPFPSAKGDLTAYQLFEVPLRSNNGFDLDTIAKKINNELKSVSEESFVSNVATNPRKVRLTMMLEVVKDVIATALAIEKAAAERAARREEFNKLSEIMMAKKDQQLTALSLEDIQARLSALSAALST